MLSKRKSYDKYFFGIVLTLSIFGLFIFTSASLGLLASANGNFGQTVFKQVLLGLLAGMFSLSIFSKIDYKIWAKYAKIIFLLSVAISFLVYLPEFGMSYNGAKRWIMLGSLTFQPAELLKLGFVIFFAGWLSSIKENIRSFSRGILPAIIFIAIPVGILLAQPDTGTSLSILSAGFAMIIIAGGRLKHVALIVLLGVFMVVSVALMKPYAMERIKTFIDPARDPQGAGYQIRQALIAVGSGGLTGRGFGQSVQKFSFLPEPIGDSVFAVACEEFGFLGGSFLILLFLAFLARGLGISERAPDSFGRLLAGGIVILISSQSFINIGAILGVLPLTGIPLLFVSHGGTALFFALSEIGIALNISRHSSV